MKILEKLENEIPKDLTHNSNVLLEIKLDDYAILSKILRRNVAFLYKLKLHQLVKDELVKDIRTIRTILEKSERGIK